MSLKVVCFAHETHSPVNFCPSPQATLVLRHPCEHVAVESVEVVMVGHVMGDHLCIDDVTFVLLAGLVQSLNTQQVQTLSDNIYEQTKFTNSFLTNYSNKIIYSSLLEPLPMKCPPTCVSVTVAVLGARGLFRATVYMISLVWLPSCSFLQG